MASNTSELLRLPLLWGTDHSRRLQHDAFDLAISRFHTESRVAPSTIFFLRLEPGNRGAVLFRRAGGARCSALVSLLPNADWRLRRHEQGSRSQGICVSDYILRICSIDPRISARESFKIRCSYCRGNSPALLFSVFIAYDGLFS